MIDAGSTGSRIHAYKFNYCKSTPTYEYEVFQMIRPGLSSFAKEPEAAAKSLDQLLDLAMKSVPKDMHKCTPVAVKATAGLRFLGQDVADAILHAVKHRLETVYPFPVVKKDGVILLDGAEEGTSLLPLLAQCLTLCPGVYAWITTNYLLDAFNTKGPGYAVLDLGGGSTQIVFEPVPNPSAPVIDGEHKYTLTFGGAQRELYQHSYLGYGLMSARKSTHKLIHFMSTLTAPSSSNITYNPCINFGQKKAIDDVPVDGQSIVMSGADIGSFDACRRVVELVLAKDAVCNVKPCSFNGVYQPSLLDAFAGGKVVLLSYFYDRLSPLKPKEPLTVGTLADLAQKVCAGEASWKKHWGNDAEALSELRDRPEYCLDLTFQHSLLRLGYEFEDSRPVKVEKKISETELGWCLGATMVMLAGDLECRV